ncbi:MAG: sugar transferase [Pseudomonadota bacterium]
MYKEYHRYRRFLVVADIVIMITLFATIVEMRPWLPGKLIESGESMRFPLLYIAIFLFWHLLFLMTGVYDLARIPSFTKQLGVFTSSYFLGVFIFAGFLYFTHREMSRMLVVYFSVSNYLALLLMRYAFSRYLTRRRKGAGLTRVLVVGATDNGIALARNLMEYHGSIYHVVGFAKDGDGAATPLPASILGAIEDVPGLVRAFNVEMVIVALTESQSWEMEKLIVDLYCLPVRIYLVPDLLKLTLLQSEVETFGHTMVIGIREPVIQGSRRTIKRVFDVFTSLVLLMLLWPLMLFVAAAIRIESHGPVIFRARRVGENGRLFDMLKFRSMYSGAERLQDKVSGTDREGRIVHKPKDDPRITRVGRIIRRTSIDELPQLINVLKGEMSLVGPRPEQPFITESYEHWQWSRLAVPPGITGWWQVSGRSDLPLHLNTQYDLYYVRNYSFLLDLQILFKTVVVVFQGRGAY